MKHNASYFNFILDFCVITSSTLTYDTFCLYVLYIEQILFQVINSSFYDFVVPDP